MNGNFASHIDKNLHIENNLFSKMNMSFQRKWVKDLTQNLEMYKHTRDRKGAASSFDSRVQRESVNPPKFPNINELIKEHGMYLSFYKNS